MALRRPGLHPRSGSDIDHYLRVTVTYTDPQGFREGEAGGFGLHDGVGRPEFECRAYVIVDSDG